MITAHTQLQASRLRTRACAGDRLECRQNPHSSNNPPLAEPRACLLVGYDFIRMHSTLLVYVCNHGSMTVSYYFEAKSRVRGSGGAGNDEFHCVCGEAIFFLPE